MLHVLGMFFVFLLQSVDIELQVLVQYCTLRNMFKAIATIPCE